MNPKQIVDEAQTCCAHIKVIYERINHEGGLCSDSWKCKDCGTRFVPERIQTAIEKALKLCNDRREELRHKLHEATDRINEYRAALKRAL